MVRITIWQFIVLLQYSGERFAHLRLTCVHLRRRIVVAGRPPPLALERQPVAHTGVWRPNQLIPFVVIYLGRGGEREQEQSQVSLRRSRLLAAAV